MTTRRSGPGRKLMGWRAISENPCPHWLTKNILSISKWRSCQGKGPRVDMAMTICFKCDTGWTGTFMHDMLVTTYTQNILVIKARPLGDLNVTKA